LSEPFLFFARDGRKRRDAFDRLRPNGCHRLEPHPYPGIGSAPRRVVVEYGLITFIEQVFDAAINLDPVR
jgi:hypothetical protein